MLSPIAIAGAIPRIRSTYRILRDKLDPQGACKNLAIEYGCSTEFARRLVSFKEPTRICKICWGEYIHTRNDRRHLCDECLAEVYILENSRKYEETVCRRLFPPRFLTGEETVANAILMLTAEFGMTREEALRYIGEVQDENAVIPAEMVDEERMFS